MYLAAAKAGTVLLIRMAAAAFTVPAMLLLDRGGVVPTGYVALRGPPVTLALCVIVDGRLLRKRVWRVRKGQAITEAPVAGGQAAPVGLPRAVSPPASGRHGRGRDAPLDDIA